MLAIVLGAGEGRASSAPASPADIMAALQANRDAIHNVHCVVIWTDYQQNRPASWEKQTRYADDLGRIRIDTEKGKCDSTGARLASDGAKTYLVYDGEKTIRGSFDPNLDRFGKPTKSRDIQRLPPGTISTSPTVGADLADEALAKLPRGYRVAQIFDGLWPPPPHGPASTRNALTIVGSGVVKGLEASLADGRSVEVRESNKEPGIIELRFQLRPESDPQGLTYTARLDPQKSWVVLTVRGEGASSSVQREEQATYRDVGGGLWLPKGGSVKLWGNRTAATDAPRIDWRFEVAKVSVNAPNFDEGVFNVTLEPDTSVGDLRYGTDYRVGEEKLQEADLAKAAQQALTERAANPYLHFAKDEAARWAIGTWLLTALLATTVCVVLALMVWRWRRSAA